MGILQLETGVPGSQETAPQGTLLASPENMSYYQTLGLLGFLPLGAA